MNLKTLLVIGVCAVAPAGLQAQTLPGFTFNSGDNSFSYDDPDDPGAVVTGYIRKPTTAAANGQAMVICHGKGGSAANFNSQHAANFVTWGFYCIVPQLSHAGAGGGSSSNEGYCPENSRIGRACLKILAATPTVDATRVAMFGHSMGAYFTGGFCGENPSPYPALRAAVEGAGGSQGTGGSSTNALPTQAEVAGITAPMLLFHGTQDTTYPRSQELKSSLDSHGVPNRLLLYQAVPHAIMDANQKRTDVYAISRAWFTTQGVLSYPANTAPVITAPAGVTVNAGVASAPVSVTIGDAETVASSLTVQAFSLDADVAGTTTPPVPAYSGRLNNSGLVWGGSGANRTLTITPAAGVTGTVDVALVVTDGTAASGQLAAVSYLQVTIQNNTPPPTINFRPEISWIADQRSTPGVAVSNIAFTVGDVETAAAALSVTAASSNTTLLPLSGITFGGGGASRTVSLVPAAGQSGLATITLTVSDGEKSCATAFTFTVANAVGGNTAPTISSLAPEVIAAGSVFGPATLIVKDTEQAENTLTVTASSSNTTLAPVANIVFGGTSYGRTVQVTPAAGQSGRATITLTVSDGTNTSSSAFVLEVLAGNAAPAISGLPGLRVTTTAESAPVISFIVSDAETAVADLRVTATSSNTALLPNSGITHGGSGANRTITLLPAVGQTGAATVTLVLNDGDYTRRAQLLLVVHDPAAASAQFSRPRGVFILDSGGATNYTTTFGKAISLRDGNIRGNGFVDGFTLRVAWDDVESGTTPGSYDFFIIQNLLTKLPAGQRLSIIITPGDPAYIAASAGVETWDDAGTLRATPWDTYLRERRRALLQAMSNLVTGGVALKDDPRLDMLDPYLPGGFTGIRDPNSVPLRNLPGYTRQKFLEAVQDELRSLQARFPGKFIQIGFWPVTDNENAGYGGLTASEWLRQQLLAEFNGVVRPRVGFFMENLAAKRNGPQLDPYSATPVTGFASPMFAGRDATWNGFQMLGSWTRPFNDGHVVNTLYGTPNDAMEYAFNTYRAEYHEVYIGDIDNTAFQPALQRWHDFFATAATTNPASDEDADGLPLAWEQAHGLSPTLANDATGDGDHDGLPLFLEYAFNQDPYAASTAALPAAGIATHPGDGLSYLHFTYLRRADAPQLTYTVEVSDTLNSWQSGPAYTQESSVVPAGDGICDLVTVRILPALDAMPARRFARLRVH